MSADYVYITIHLPLFTVYQLYNAQYVPHDLYTYIVRLQLPLQIYIEADIILHSLPS